MQGPEKPIYIERIFSFLHLPYLVGCLCLTIIFGPFGAMLLELILGGSFEKGLDSAFLIYFNGTVSDGTVNLLSGIIGLSLLSTLLFYVMYMTQRMRLRLLSVKDPLLPLLSNNSESYDKTFKGVSNALPPIFISSTFLLVLLTQSFDSFVKYCCNIPRTAYFIISIFTFFCAFFTFVWVYFSSLYGLHLLGKKFIHLKLFYEDKMLGVKPIGSLSLSFAFIYFIGITILIIMPGVFSTNSPGIMYLLYLLILVLVGMALFILPLYTTHIKMVEAKRNEQEKIRKDLLTRVKSSSESSLDSNKQIKETLDQLTSILNINITKDEIMSIPTWPIDTSIINRFGMVILIPIITTIVARYIIDKILIIK
jgi:hypothetical protein